MTSTSAEEVIELFAAANRPRQLLAGWRSRHSHVVDHVLNHITDTPYRLLPSAVAEVCATTTHALGQIRKESIRPVKSIADWRPDFALTHVFHYVLEQSGTAYTFQEFRQFCVDDPTARRMLWEPAQHMVASTARDGHAPAVARDAMQWRIGCAYYSFLRELYTVTALRSRGIDLRIHPLADALFRVDAWQARTVVSLYIGNREYRDGPDGRKQDVHSLYSAAEPPFKFVDIRLETPRRFGHVHLPTDDALDAAAHDLT